MSAIELRQIWEEYRRQNITNINCGMLRRIGKTECLIQIMLECPVSVRKVLIVPSDRNTTQFMLHGGLNLIYINSTSQSINEFFRGNNDPTAVYADEVPNAQYLIEALHINSIHFIAGFYSDFEHLQRQEDRNVRRTLGFDLSNVPDFSSISLVSPPINQSDRILETSRRTNHIGIEPITDRNISVFGDLNSDLDTINFSTTSNHQQNNFSYEDINRAISMIKEQEQTIKHIKPTITIKQTTVNKMKFISR
jgi:hypothetical protein